MTPYRPQAIFSPRAKIGRLQFVAGFGYLWLFSIAVALLLIWAQSLPPLPRLAFTVIAVLGSLAIWVLIALWLKARLADAGMSPLWIATLVLLFASELRAALLNPQPPSADPLAGVSGWDQLRVATAVGFLALLFVLLFVKSRPTTKALETKR